MNNDYYAPRPPIIWQEAFDSKAVTFNTEAETKKSRGQFDNFFREIVDDDIYQAFYTDICRNLRSGWKTKFTPPIKRIPNRWMIRKHLMGILAIHLNSMREQPYTLANITQIIWFLGFYVNCYFDREELQLKHNFKNSSKSSDPIFKFLIKYKENPYLLTKKNRLKLYAYWQLIEGYLNGSIDIESIDPRWLKREEVERLIWINRHYRKRIHDHEYPDLEWLDQLIATKIINIEEKTLEIIRPKFSDPPIFRNKYQDITVADKNWLLLFMISP